MYHTPYPWYYYPIRKLSIYPQSQKIQQKIKILTQNFQNMTLRVYQVHPYLHEWPCPPLIWSGTLNLLQVPPFSTPYSLHTSSKDINTKFSGYLPFGQTRPSMTSRTTISSWSLIRNPQCPSSIPFLYPTYLTHF